ncbi:MAG: hypothetical protein H7841_00855 [Magnetospirillum sp. WYHS-4]
MTTKRLAFTQLTQADVDAFAEAARKFTAKHTKTKASALKILQKEGLITKSGKLTKRYGG